MDEALPTTAALAEHYSVSQATIARVLRAFTAEAWCTASRVGVSARLLEVGFDEIRLLVSRPLKPRERKGSSEARQHSSDHTPVGTRRSSRCSAFGVCPPRVERECSFCRSYGYLRSDHGELDVCCNSMEAYTRRSLAEDLGC